VIYHHAVGSANISDYSVYYSTFFLAGYFFFSIESTKSPGYLDGRIEAFIDSLQDLFDHLTADEFNQHVAALKQTLLETPKQLSREFDRNLHEINEKKIIFNRGELEAKFLENVKQKDVTSFYNEFVQMNAPKRAKLAVYVLAKDLDECADAPGDVSGLPRDFNKTPRMPEYELITDIVEFKKGKAVIDQDFPFLSPASS